MLEQNANCNALLMSMNLSVFAAFQDNVMLCRAVVGYIMRRWIVGLQGIMTRSGGRGGSVKLGGEGSTGIVWDEEHLAHLLLAGTT